MNMLLLVQHCQSHHHVDRRAGLWPDKKNGLTDFGHGQAQCLAQRVKQLVGERECRLFSSDMQRARETAAHIAEELALAPILVPEFREWNGRLALERDSDGAEWPKYEGDDAGLMDWRPFAQGESWREFYTRVATRMTQLSLEMEPDCLPILVLHGGSVSNIVVWWLRLSLDALPDRAPFMTSPGAISLLKRNKYHKPQLSLLNDRAHLCRAGIETGAYCL